jgi:hypothetical protein
MQPFYPARSAPVRHPTAPEGVDPRHSELVEDPPSPGMILREIGVILLVCLGFGLAAELLVRTLGVH